MAQINNSEIMKMQNQSFAGKLDTFESQLNQWKESQIRKFLVNEIEGIKSQYKTKKTDLKYESLAKIEEEEANDSYGGWLKQGMGEAYMAQTSKDKTKLIENHKLALKMIQKLRKEFVRSSLLLNAQYKKEINKCLNQSKEQVIEKYKCKFEKKLKDYLNTHKNEQKDLIGKYFRPYSNFNDIRDINSYLGKKQRYGAQI